MVMLKPKESAWLDQWRIGYALLDEWMEYYCGIFMQKLNRRRIDQMQWINYSSAYTILRWFISANTKSA